MNNLRDDILLRDDVLQPYPAMLEEHSGNDTEGDLNLNAAVTALLDPSSKSTATEGEHEISNPSPDSEATKVT